MLQNIYQIASQIFKKASPSIEMETYIKFKKTRQESQNIFKFYNNGTFVYLF